MTPALEVRDLQVQLHSPRGVVHAVESVSFSVESGHIHGVVGESGSGKTTLLRAILGLPPASAVVDGVILVDGEERPPRTRRRRGPGGIGIVFQEPMTALNPVMTVGRQVSEAPRVVLGMSQRTARQRSLELMTQVGIPDPVRRYDSYPHELSGGLRQRVLIAMALSSEPHIVLCDEPTTALDVTVQDQILRLFRRIAEETGVAIVYVTHDLAVVGEICSSLSVMYAGQFIESGPVPEVFHHPRHPYTLGLMQALPDVERGGEQLIPIPGTPPDLVNPAPGCPFFPRCTYAEARCRETAISLEELTDSRATACIRHYEIFGDMVREGTR